MSNITLNTRPLNLRIKYPFGISRGSSTIAENVLVTLCFDDIVSYGEAAPSSFYGEDQKSVTYFIKSFVKNRSFDVYLTNINKLKEDLDSFNLSISQQLRSNIFSYSARAAIEMAFWDLIGKIQKKSLYEFIFMENPFYKKDGKYGISPTSYTIGLDTLPVMREKIQFALKNGFSILKIKLGKGLEEDKEILKAINKEISGYSCRLRVDANGGWDLETTKRMLEVLSGYNIELLEQPLPRGEVNKLAPLLSESTFPIIVDEDCLVASDIEALAGKVHGINIKLMKTGSILEALSMINLARAYNLKVMLGCMIESSCSISAAVHLSPLVDYVDLDGHLLLESDPFSGLVLENSRILPSFDYGLGVSFSEN